MNIESYPIRTNDYDRGYFDGAFEKNILIRKAREGALDEVLEVIDDRIRYWTSKNQWSIPVEWVKESYEADREKILKLKGG